MKKILTVIDMQKDFTTGPLGNAECAAAIGPVVREITSGRYDKIYVTYDTHHEDYMETREGRFLPVPHCIEGSEGWQLADEIEAALVSVSSGIVRIRKPTFGSTALQAAIVNDLANTPEGIEVTIVGVCTGICVISNAMLIKAACPEIDVRVISDACACVSPETHRTALEAMRLCQIEVK